MKFPFPNAGRPNCPQHQSASPTLKPLFAVHHMSIGDNGEEMYSVLLENLLGTRSRRRNGKDLRQQIGDRPRRNRGENRRGPNRKWSVLINAAAQIEASSGDTRNDDTEHDDGPHRGRVMWGASSAPGDTFSSRLKTQLTSDMNYINIKTMRHAIRTVKSYSIEPDIDQYVRSTKGKQSASERVNQLLRRAVEEEQQEALAREASAFFSKARNRRRTGARAFQKASMRTLTRDD